MLFCLFFRYAYVRPGDDPELATYKGVELQMRASEVVPSDSQLIWRRLTKRGMMNLYSLLRVPLNVHSMIEYDENVLGWQWNLVYPVPRPSKMNVFGKTSYLILYILYHFSLSNNWESGIVK